LTLGNKVTMSLNHSILALIAITTFSFACARQNDTTKDDIKTLSSLNYYGFGKRLGQDSERKSDTAFYRLLNSRNANDNFIELFNNGNEVGKLYALYGLFRIKSKDFIILSQHIERYKL
jgi:hypothetical protein